MVNQANKEYDPRELETRVRARWDETGAYHATRKHRADGARWYFIDGPPYATGHIHLGTAWNKTLKDCMLRFKAMRGHNVRDQPGYDMHGLPIEVKVEQSLGISNKKEIEDMGIGAFVEKCREFALGFKDTMTEEFKALGVWMDWDNPYMTLTNDYMEGAWWALKRAHERGLLFQAERGISWCPRCETALAEAELEYWEETDPSIFVKFPVKGEDDTYLVIWTTTPWTLPANNAVAVHPEMTYVKVWAKKGDREETLIVAEDLADSVAAAGKYQQHYVVEHVQGEALEGISYAHPFLEEVPYHQEPKSERSYTVLLGEHVTAEYTGLVHTATGHGAEDFALGQEYGIPPFSPVGPDGHYTEEAGVYAGLPLKEANARVISDLDAKGLLLHAGELEHRYGHCWRCKTPIVFRTTNQWFLKITDVQDRLVDEVSRVDWTPDWAGSARQMDWVKNARDWCVSRQRYWGIPIPVWRDDNGHWTVIGSRAELAERATNYEAGQDLHRPWIDDVRMPCDACGEEMRRVPDVLDVWFDSAVAAWAELGYPGSEAEYEKWFPCDWIVEGLDQTRGWFYSQLGAGVAAMDRAPYDAVLMHGFIHDESGRPMSKSLGNIISPEEVIEKHGADSFRFYVLTASAPWDDVSFSWEGVRTTHRSLNILWNVHVFATTYMALDGFQPEADWLDSHVADALRAEDRWLLSRLHSLTEEVTENLERAHLHRATRALEAFILDDLSRWYVRLIRDRTWTEAEDADKQAAYHTLHAALDTVARLMAPFTPHLADQVYTDLGGDHPTVHMADWPHADAALRDPGLEDAMARARDIVEAASNARQQGGMKLRWPVQEIVVSGDDDAQAAVDALEAVILDQANAKAVRFVGHAWEGLVLVAEPNRSAIGPTFKGDAPKVMDAIRGADARALKEALDAGGAWTAEAEGAAFEVTPGMVKFSTTLPEHMLGADFPGGSVYVNTELTPEIEAEGLARELIRRVQEMRKEMDLPVDAPIHTTLRAPPEMAEQVRGWIDAMAAETRSESLRFVEEAAGDHVKAWDVEGDEVVVGVTRA